MRSLPPRNWKFRRSSWLLKTSAFVIARRAQPGVAIQPFVDLTDYLDCFASLVMTILSLPEPVRF